MQQPSDSSNDEARVIALTRKVLLEPNDTKRLAALCGPLDQNLKHLEKRLSVHIRNRGNEFQVSGPEVRVEAAAALLHQLYRETYERESIEPEFVHLYLQEAGIESLLRLSSKDEQGSSPGKQGGLKESGNEAPSGEVVIRTYKKPVKPRGKNQLAYCHAIREFDISFGVGPAGTGKTFLAVACAVEALESQRVSRILLVRPAVEAGEKLGFLPGDLAQKIDPYLRPLYDALYEMMGIERVTKFIERNIIEVAPLAYMRGRTLNNAFIILDESQNTTIAQMKMFLTRIGFGSTAVITGDITQIDLPRGEGSGLVNVRNVLRGVDGISFTHFGSSDVVRHPLVQKIVDAYAIAESARDSNTDRDAG
ncbi:MAG: PhoH family protein [Gammaproteobacteria bacterium]|nr:PhoH family protein [Gammaproteobacteria bacterium]